MTAALGVAAAVAIGLALIGCIFRWAHVETELRRFLARDAHAKVMRDRWGPKPASPEDGARSQ